MSTVPVETECTGLAESLDEWMQQIEEAAALCVEVEGAILGGPDPAAVRHGRGE